MGNLVVEENMYGHDSEKNESIPIHLEHYFITEPGSVFPPHWHEQFMIMYIVKGMLLLQCGDSVISAEQETIAIVNPNEIHSGESMEPDLEYYLIKMDLILLLGNQPDLNQTVYSELLMKNLMQFENKINSDDFLVACVQNIIKENQEKRKGYEFALRGLVYQLLTLLLRSHTKAVSNQSQLEMQYRRLNQIKPSIDYMELNFGNKITLEQLAEAVHLSTIHFSRVFKMVSGLSPMEFLNGIRIQKASELLINTNKAISEIAMNTGFNDANYFSRLFKKSRGKSPREFRKKYTKTR